MLFCPITGLQASESAQRACFHWLSGKNDLDAVADLGCTLTAEVSPDMSCYSLGTTTKSSR